MGMLDFIASVCNRLLLPWWDSAVLSCSVLRRDPEGTSDGSAGWHLVSRR